MFFNVLSLVVEIVMVVPLIDSRADICAGIGEPQLTMEYTRFIPPIAIPPEITWKGEIVKEVDGLPML